MFRPQFDSSRACLASKGRFADGRIQGRNSMLRPILCSGMILLVASSALPQVRRLDLFDAAGAQDWKTVEGLLDADPKGIAARNEKGLSLLHVAAIEGHKDATELLLARGADVNAQDQDGVTPLHFAVNWG